jgi:hypothetical protein
VVAGPNGGGSPDTLRRAAARIIAGPRAEEDPRERERERLLERLLGAEGRASITAAAEAVRSAGFELPSDQRVWLQLLEHRDEAIVAEALERLARILESEPPLRRTVLESRLRSIEELGEDAAVREQAASLRRLLGRFGDAAPFGRPSGADEQPA